MPRSFWNWLAFALIELLKHVLGTSGLKVSVISVGGCGEITTLKCEVSNESQLNCDVERCDWYKDNRVIFEHQNKHSSAFTDKYEARVGYNYFILNINNTATSDSGMFRCSFGFITSNYTPLTIQCDVEHQKQQSVSGDVEHQKQQSVSDPMLLVPTIGNCGDITTLTCKPYSKSRCDCQHEHCGWFKDNIRISLKEMGVVNESKYEQQCGLGNFSLQIRNTDLTDEGAYKCHIGHRSSNYVSLQIECKASSKHVTVMVTLKKTLIISLDRLYPKPNSIVVHLLGRNGSAVLMKNGTIHCHPGIEYKTFTRCNWTSEDVIGDDSYGCNITVTTITQALPIIKHFKIVIPKYISLTMEPNKDQNILDGSVTMRCSSDCAYPMVNITWFYRQYRCGTSTLSPFPSTLERSEANCNNSESVYSSTLILNMNTSFGDKQINDVQFECGILSFIGLTNPMYTPLSKRIYFSDVLHEIHNKQVPITLIAGIFGSVFGFLILGIAFAKFYRRSLSLVYSGMTENVAYVPAVAVSREDWNTKGVNINHVVYATVRTQPQLAPEKS